MQTIVLEGNPISTQALYKIVKFPGRYGLAMTKEGKALKESYSWQAKSQYRHGLLKGDIWAAAYLYFKNNRIHDVDNFSKIWMDSFNGIVWEDDKQVKRLMIEKRLDTERPRIEVNFGTLSLSWYDNMGGYYGRDCAE